MDIKVEEVGMSLSRTLTRALLAILPGVVWAAPQAVAQDVDAMAKWTALTVVHYRVVGEFSGEARVFSFNKTFPVADSALVADRVEIEFDWDQNEMKLVGKPVVRNFPSKVAAISPLKGCPVTKLEGAFEFATVTGLKDMSPGVGLDVKRDHPGGAVPHPAPETGSAACGHAWQTVAPQSTTVQGSGFVVPPAMALAMPGIVPISPDGKSLILEEKGWTWTLTPTPVR